MPHLASMLTSNPKHLPVEAFCLSWGQFSIPLVLSPLWQRWLMDIPKLSQFTIERCLKPADLKNTVSSQLHHFSDASEIAFGAVLYLRLEDDCGRIYCTILQGKSRLVPLKQITILHRELSAATVSILLDKILKRELELSLTDESTFWTGSMSVLRYIRNESKRFHTFVANCIAVIRDGSHPDQWRHVAGYLNPRDNLPRGLSAEALLNSDRWLKGPEFLWLPKEFWPLGPLSLGSVLDTDPEVMAKAKVNVTSATQSSCPLIEYFGRKSSWYRLKKPIAWILRYRESLLTASQGKRPIKSTLTAPKRPITVEEMKAAELEILKSVQKHHFAEEFYSLTKSAGKGVPHVGKSSCLRRLDPILIVGLLRVGGRLTDYQHQIILPKNDHVSNLLIEHYHQMSGHSGREYMLSLLRERFSSSSTS